MKINSIHSNVFFQKRAVAKANVLNGSKPISCTIYQLEEDKDWRYFNKQGAAWKDAEYVDLIADYLKMVHCKKDFSYSGVYVIENQYGECLGYCEYGENKEAFADKCVKELGLPVFIKPANAGSSVGISKAKTKEDILKAMETAFREDSKIVAEEAVDGREVECAVIGNDYPIASVIGEILPSNEFYDYEAKYISNESTLCIPADIPREKSDEIRNIALKAYKTMGCKGLSRVDFFIRNSDGAVLFNEINTMPGFTSISMHSKLFEASGIPYGELVDRLITLGLEK